MSSISPTCQTLKDEYDACFNSWFTEHYLKGDTKADMCTNLFKKYQACIKEAIKEHNITLWEPEHEPICMPTGDTAFDIRNPDDMHRQSSRNPTLAVDGIDCLVHNNDLALENEALNQANEQRRRSNGSRQESTTSRRNNHDDYHHRSTRHSPSSSRKRPLSPSSARHLSTSSVTARSHHHHYPTQRQQQQQQQHRSPSPSPPRHHRSSRPGMAMKRPLSHSRSPHERRPPSHRSRQHSPPRERTVDDELMAISISEEQQQQKSSSSSKSKRDEDTLLPTDKITPIREAGADLSLVSEDESNRPNGTTNEQSSSSVMATNTNRHSVPVPQSQSTTSSMLESSQDCELSNLHPSTPRTPSAIFPINDLTQTIELINKYKLMQAQPSNDAHVNAWNKEIHILIQRQIELQRKELDHREREMSLRERELIEREKRLNERSNNETIPLEPIVAIQSSSLPIDEKPPSTAATIETISNEDTMTTTTKTIPSSIVEATKTKNGFKQIAKHRSLSTRIDPAIFASSKPTVDLYSNDDEEDLNKQITIEPSTSVMEIDPKVISPGFCRKVEFQSGGTGEKSTTNIKSSSTHDLRLTLTKHRQFDEHSNGNDSNSQDNINNEEENITMISKTIAGKHSKDDKQRSRDYPQRSVTSTPIDGFNEKRDYHHQQQRTASTSRHQQPGQPPTSMYSPPTTIPTSERPYSHASVPQQQPRYGSNHRRHESGDLRSHLFEQNKHPKSSRPPHRNNY